MTLCHLMSVAKRSFKWCKSCRPIRKLIPFSLVDAFSLSMPFFRYLLNLKTRERRRERERERERERGLAHYGPNHWQWLMISIVKIDGCDHAMRRDHKNPLKLPEKTFSK